MLRPHGQASFVGSGHGGHLQPLLAVAHAVHRARSCLLLSFANVDDGVGLNELPEGARRLATLQVWPIRGRGVRGGLRGSMQAAHVVKDCVSLLKRERPRVVFSGGGNEAGPLSLAARLLGIPIALIEPNCEIGLANHSDRPLRRARLHYLP